MSLFTEGAIYADSKIRDVSMNQRIVRWLLALLVLFILYNTLIPFTFDQSLSDLPSLLREFTWQMPDSDDISLTDIAGNILLFLPFGFVMYMFLFYRNAPQPLLFSTFMGAVISLFIEFVQMFIAGRDSAIHDVFNNALGSFAGALAASFYARRLASLSRKIFYQLLNRKPFLLLLLILAIVQTLSAMMPFTVSITISDLKESIKSANLAPFAYHSVGAVYFNDPNKLDTLPFDASKPIEDILFWAAGGYITMLCYRIYWRRRPYGKLLLVTLPLLYFPFLEFLQIFITSRISDVTDILSGWMGVALGYLLYKLLRPLRHKNLKSDLDLLKIPVAIYALFMLFAGLRPFDWSLSPQTLAVDMRLENLVPFYAYFRKTSLWNIYDLFSSLAFFLPLSLFWSYRQKSRGVSYTQLYILTTLAGLATGAGIEFSQFFSASRIAEITDVLAFGGGGALGTFLVYYYERQVIPTLEMYRTGQRYFG